jgi:hypothetical protein
MAKIKEINYETKKHTEKVIKKQGRKEMQKDLSNVAAQLTDTIDFGRSHLVTVFP